MHRCIIAFGLSDGPASVALFAVGYVVLFGLVRRSTMAILEFCLGAFSEGVMVTLKVIYLF